MSKMFCSILTSFVGVGRLEEACGCSCFYVHYYKGVGRALCLPSGAAAWFLSNSGCTEIKLCLWQSGQCVSVVCVWEPFLTTLKPQMLPVHPRVSTHEHTHTRKHLHLCFRHSSNWRQSMLCVPYNSQHLTPHLWTSLTAFTLQPFHQICTCTLTNCVRTLHSGCCPLFIHSCGGLHAWLGTASFFSPLSFPAIPRGTRWPQAHNSDCATHWLHSNQSHYFSEPHYSLFASPADTEPRSSNWTL